MFSNRWLKFLPSILLIGAFISLSFLYYQYANHKANEKSITSNKSPKNKKLTIDSFKEEIKSLKNMYSKNKQITTPPDYQDKAFSKSCDIHQSYREDLFKLFKEWIKFARLHNIVWFIIDSTLLGSYRHKDHIPWSIGADISVFSNSVRLLKRLQTPHDQTSLKKTNLFCRESGYCFDGIPVKRRSCDGRILNHKVDECSFCHPVCRMLYKTNRYIDLFLANIEKDENSKNSLVVFMASHYFIKDIRPTYPIEWIFPLRECKFMGLILPCPNQSKKLLQSIYGKLEADKKCENGEWVEVKV